MTRRMLEVGVEGDLFNEHWETSDCKQAGCLPVIRPNLYISKPQLIEAVQWNGDPDAGFDAIKEAFDGRVEICWTDQAGLSLMAGPNHSSGAVHVPVGCWIARKQGDPSDYWPIDPEHFAKTYEAADG